MDEAKRRFWRIIACILCGIYIGPLIALWIFQRDLIYVPHHAPVGPPSEYGVAKMVVANVQTEDGLTLHDWFLPPAHSSGKVIVFFHGAYENLGDIAPLAPYLGKTGYGVFFIEYRGFGDSPGAPSEQGLYADGRAGIRWLEAHGYKNSQFVFLGSSLGSGVAVQMALEFKPAYLALHTPYSSVLDVAKGRYFFYPIELLLKDRFDSTSKIGKIKAPLVIIHGTDDTTIPITLSQKLFKAANAPKKFYTIHGAGHLGLYRYMSDIVLKWLGEPLTTGKGAHGGG
jgi:fermentation-respiration switch protein FrsA (DUF1100 family)